MTHIGAWIAALAGRPDTSPTGRGQSLRPADELRQLANEVDRIRRDLPIIASPSDVDAADALASSVEALLQSLTLARLVRPSGSSEDNPVDSRVTTPVKPGVVAALTRSAIADAPFDPMASQDFSLDSDDMIGRLEPREFRWIDSTHAEQAFLGWPLEKLLTMSFLDIVHPDHRDLASEQLRGALSKGEAHGLIYRIRNAKGEAKAVEINVGVRYTAAGAVDHLRCHVTDVTERLKASRELRRRTRELLAANSQLVIANRELRELKDRYSDLYQNAPAMYFSLDESGAIRDCNDTLLTTLGYERSALIGRPYVSIVPEWRRPAFAAHFARFLSTGHADVESQWVTADGRHIDVRITGSAVFGPQGEIIRSRSLGLDITARKALESQLQEKNARLARAVEELARKNQELDDFSYSVSHDLQEPLRTLIAFSNMLIVDYGDRLDDEGREHLRYVLDASTRLRALIKDLLTLSRSGRATGEFGPVDLNGVMAQVQSDLAAIIAATSADMRVARDLPVAWGDRDRIARLLTNLVSNGLKYVKPGDRARVEIEANAQENGAVTIAVRDHGIGIDLKYHDRIFKLFRRLHARNEYEGTGAGLAICKKIVDAHGGQITVESAVGDGSTFRVHLPGRDGIHPE